LVSRRALAHSFIFQHETSSAKSRSLTTSQPASPTLKSADLMVIILNTAISSTHKRPPGIATVDPVLPLQQHKHSNAWYTGCNFSYVDSHNLDSATRDSNAIGYHDDESCLARRQASTRRSSIVFLFWVMYVCHSNWTGPGICRTSCLFIA